MAMVMYLFTCGFVCDNSNVYSTCNIHTDSKCITCSNAFTSKHDIVINVHESHYSASASSFNKHSLNSAQRLFCGGTQRNTAKRLYTGTQYVVVVTGHSNKMLSGSHTWGYITVQGITRCAWCSCSPWACTRMIWGLHTCLHEKFCKVAAKNCAGRFLLDNRRYCTTLAKVRCLQTQTCEELKQSKDALPEIHWREDSPAQPLVERDGLQVCAVQWAERLHWPGRWCSLFTAATML